MQLRGALHAALALCGALACGPSGSGDCVALSGRESIDDVIARVPEGATICLPVGEIAPPRAPISRTVTLRGATDASGGLASTLSGPAGSCLVATGVDSGVDRYPTIDASGVVVTAGTAAVTLESLVVRGCVYGVVARAGHTTLRSVRIESVLVATLVDGGATLEVQSSDFASGTRRADGSGPSLGVGVLSGSGTTLLLTDLDVDGSGAGIGIRGRPRVVNMQGGELHALSFAIGIEDTTDTARDVQIRGSRFHSLVPVVLTGAPRYTGSLLSGGSVTIEDALIEGSGDESFGIEFQGVEHAVVRGSTFTGHDIVSLGLFGGALSVEAGNTMTIPAASATNVPYGVVSAPHPTMGTAGAVTFASGGVALTSTAGAGSIHLAVQDSSIVSMGATIGLTGGAIGALASGASALTLAGAGFTTSGTTTAGVASRDTATATLDGIAITPAADSVGVAEEGGATLHATGLTITGGRFAVQAEDHAALTIDGGTFVGATQSGIYVTSDATAITLRSVAIDGALVGVVAEGAGVRVRLQDGVIHDTGAAGAEAHTGAELSVIHTEIRGAHGVALAFVDADGFVAGSMLSGTLIRADGRADDVRVVSTDGGAHSVDFGDDGDGTITAGDQNFIVLDAARTCAGQCSVVMSDGVGAQAIVRPNCLNGDATASADVHTLLDQDGGTFVIPMPVAWPGLFAGIASNLGLVPGGAASVTGLPVPTIPPAAAAAIPGGA